MGVLGRTRGAPSGASLPGGTPRLAAARAGDRLLYGLWESARLWRHTALVLATTGLALLVAALIAREPPDFAERPVIAVLRDKGQHPIWTVRLARRAHQIAVDNLGAARPPAGKDYQLWLITPGEGAQPLGLLSSPGRKIFAETPANIRRLAGGARLQVTIEPVTGSLAGAPSGPVEFAANIKNRE